MQGNSTLGVYPGRGVSFTDLTRLGVAAKVREAGRLPSERRDYLVQDGDLLLFRCQR